jgi:uncharacterized protein YnzC (UPF0291/DUF896 family)
MNDNHWMTEMLLLERVRELHAKAQQAHTAKQHVDNQQVHRRSFLAKLRSELSNMTTADRNNSLDSTVER